MKKLSLIVLILTSLNLYNCSKQKSNLLADKEYFTTQEYKNTLEKIKSDYEKNKELPNFKNNETKVIVEKLTSKENFYRITDNPELTPDNKVDSCRAYLELSSEVIELYSKIDLNKFRYENEMINLFDFILSIQRESLTVIQLGLKKQLKNPKTSIEEINFLMIDAENTIIGNYSELIAIIKEKNLYSTKGLDFLSKTIEYNVTELVKKSPIANYDPFIESISLLINNGNFREFDPTLIKINSIIESKRDTMLKREIGHFNVNDKKEMNTLSDGGFKTKKAMEINQQGLELVKRNLYETGLEKFFEALDAEPENPMILMNIGLTYLEIENFEKSIDYFKQALVYSNNPNIIKINLSLLYYNTKQYTKGVKIASEIIRNESNKEILAPAYIHRALNSIKLGNCNQGNSDLNYLKDNFSEVNNTQYHINDLSNKLERCAE